MSELSNEIVNLGITSSAKHIQLVACNGSKDAWDHDEWSIILSYKGRTMFTSYSTGLGHRKMSSGVKKTNDMYSGPKGNVRIIEAALVGYTVPVKPDIADVVYSLMMDASFAQYTFDEWCSELGHNTDSRAALDTYLQCQENYTKLKNLLGRGTYQSLVGLEH